MILEVRIMCFGKINVGSEAMAYKFTSLLPRIEVLCTVLSQAVENRRILVWCLCPFISKVDYLLWMTE